MKSAGDMTMKWPMYKQGDLNSVDTADHDGPNEMMGDKSKILTSQTTNADPTFEKKGANPGNDWAKISKMAGNKDEFYNF